MNHQVKTILHQAKRQAIGTAARLGVPALWQHVTGRRHLILMFHRIRPTGQPLDPFDTCPSYPVDVFRVLLEYVANRFQVVTLHELVSRLAERRPLAAITFDDGWRDNYDLGFAVLNELNLPATVFLTAGKIGSSEPFWQQTLGERFRLANEANDSADVATLRSVLDVPEKTSLNPTGYRQTVLHWKRLSPRDRRERIRRLLAVSADQSEGPRRFLSAWEIREMRNAGIEFGSHTVSHQLLAGCQPDDLQHELADSKAQIEDLVKEPVDSIAYPNGSFSESVVRTARAIGYQIGCTIYPARVGAKDDPLLLPRVDPDCGCRKAPGRFDPWEFAWRSK